MQRTLVELIAAKRDGGTLTNDEIGGLLRSFGEGALADYQMAAFLMAVFFRGLDDAETVALFEHQQALSPLGLPVVAEAALRRRVRHLSLKYPELRVTLEKLGRVGRRTRREEKSDNSGAENRSGVENNGAAHGRA